MALQSCIDKNKKLVEMVCLTKTFTRLMVSVVADRRLFLDLPGHLLFDLGICWQPFLAPEILLEGQRFELVFLLIFRLSLLTRRFIKFTVLIRWITKIVVTINFHVVFVHIYKEILTNDQVLSVTQELNQVGLAVFLK